MKKIASIPSIQFILCLPLLIAVCCRVIPRNGILSRRSYAGIHTHYVSEYSERNGVHPLGCSATTHRTHTHTVCLMCGIYLMVVRFWLIDMLTRCVRCVCIAKRLSASISVIFRRKNLLFLLVLSIHLTCACQRAWKIDENGISVCCLTRIDFYSVSHANANAMLGGCVCQVWNIRFSCQFRLFE